MGKQLDLSQPLQDDEIELLDTFLVSLENDEACLNLSELDGFFAAVVSSPEKITSSKWLPIVWGGEANTPEWESSDQQDLIVSLLTRHQDNVAAFLAEAPDEFEPMFMEREYEGKYIMIVDEWCIGYAKGSNLWQVEEEPLVDTALESILLFATEEGMEQLDMMDPDEIEAMQQQIAVSARNIHAFYHAKK